jgi:hypothetical protein
MKVSLELAAQILIKRKMVELGFVHTGFGPNRGLLPHKSYSWITPSGLFNEDMDRKLRNAAENDLKQCVEDWSTQWKKQAAWSNTEKNYLLYFLWYH